MRPILPILIALFLALPALAKSKPTIRGEHSKDKNVHVESYVNKRGKLVKEHYRRSPGTKPHKKRRR